MPPCPKTGRLARDGRDGWCQAPDVQGWTADNRLANVIRSDLVGAILATTAISYHGDGVTAGEFMWGVKPTRDPERICQR